MPLNVRICRLRFGKIVVFLVVIVILLQVIHMSLLSRLEAKENGRTRKKKSPETFSKVYRGIIERIKNSHKFDHSGTYHMLDNVLIREWKPQTSELGNKFDVTLVTQCSSNHLHHSKVLSHRWNGPISLTVFTHGSEVVHALQALAHVYLCSSHVKKWTSFHLVFPISQAPDLSSMLDVNHFHHSCDNFEFKVSGHENYANANIPFPHNLLRNVAISFSKTPYIFLVDIDMVPSPGLRTGFQNLMARTSAKNKRDNSTESEKAAYVVPAFEIKENEPLPSSKTELLMGWKKGSLRPFYADVCWKCQKHVDYDKWSALEDKTQELQAVYTLTWKDPWEPFFIAPQTLPLYDERFKQYGFNRISQVCEMHIAGFQFSVLNLAFLLHRGFKSVEKFHTTKEEELNRNRLLFRHFKEELKTKYPESPRRCY